MEWVASAAPGVPAGRGLHIGVLQARMARQVIPVNRGGEAKTGARGPSSQTEARGMQVKAWPIRPQVRVGNPL